METPWALHLSFVPSTRNTSLWLALCYPHLSANTNWENSFLNTLFKGINPLLLPHHPVLVHYVNSLSSLPMFTYSLLYWLLHEPQDRNPMTRQSLMSSRCAINSSSTEELSPSPAQGHMPTFPALRRLKAGPPQVWSQLGHHGASQWDLSQRKGNMIISYSIYLVTWQHYCQHNQNQMDASCSRKDFRKCSRHKNNFVFLYCSWLKATMHNLQGSLS